MHVNLAASYTKALGISPRQMFECAAANCQNHFLAQDGLAYPGQNSDGEVHMFFFCSTECILRVISVAACWRA